MKEPSDPLDALAFSSERLTAQPVVEPVEDVEVLLDSEVRNSWANFRAAAPGQWKASVDKRHGRIDFAEGTGIPWVPGRGNKLAYGADKKLDLADLESVARRFLPQVAKALGVNPSALVMNRGRSGHPADYLWFVDFDVYRNNIPIDGARVVFRVNNGNLVQFGSENLPPEHARTPSAKLKREEALAAVAEYIGGFHSTDIFVDAGSLHLLTTAESDSRFDDGFDFGKGRGLAAAWQFTFRRDGSQGTWRARVDAETGEMLDFYDINNYAEATGGVKILGTSTNLPMPFTDLSSGGYTNSAGVYTHGGDPVTSSLSGQFVNIVDNCGAISVSADASGDLAFGTSPGTDCTTPGFGGAGNTHSSRTQFYYVNRAKEMARGWLPGNTWLAAQLTVNGNLNEPCRAFWQRSLGTLNFNRSGMSSNILCANTGEIEAIVLHEFGHGLDFNDGSGFSDQGTEETYGDFTAALTTHSSCIGPGFTASNCDGYGDPCTSCTGVRDIDWAKHSSNTPHTVANFTQPHCPLHPTYRGPCGRQGHCESHISSEALWDFANRDLALPGTRQAWSVVDRLWYLSRSTATNAFTCNRGTSPWTSDGCTTGSLWRTMRAVDDDDGNLANGTPHSAALYAAFNRHDIACTTDLGANNNFRGCLPPAVPTLTLTPGNNLVTVSWSSVGSGIVYDVYRNEAGCNAGFIKVANNVSGTSFADGAVADGFAYYYQVVAHPSANEACHAAPTTCQSVVPNCTLVAPTGLTATAVSASQVHLSWSAGAGGNVDHYEIQRAQTHSGPFSTVASVTGTSFTDETALGDVTYIYRVRGVCSGNNHSNFSSTDVATTVIFTDDPLVPGVLIKAEHMSQLRRAVGAMRVAAQLQPVNWSDPNLLGISVKATHIQELRSNLDAALAILGRPVPQYTDPNLVSNVTLIKAVHWQEIRSRVK